jgi:hypothetical protein
MIPEIRNRIDTAPRGGALATIMRAELKADDHMRAKPSPITNERMSILIFHFKN